MPTLPVNRRLLKIRGTCCVLSCTCLPRSPVVLSAKKLKVMVVLLTSYFKTENDSSEFPQGRILSRPRGKPLGNPSCVRGPELRPASQGPRGRGPSSHDGQHPGRRQRRAEALTANRAVRAGTPAAALRSAPPQRVCSVVVCTARPVGERSARGAGEGREGGSRGAQSSRSALVLDGSQRSQ